MTLFSGPTVQTDAEDTERSRWVRVFADLLQGTATLLGHLLAEQPGCVNLLGGGRRASTLRAPVRAAWNFLAWPSNSYNVACPTERAHATDYFATRQSEPCTRNALKCSHVVQVFLGETYTFAFQELLYRATKSKPTRQAPRMYTSILALLEGIVCNTKSVPFFRVYSWSVLVQNLVLSESTVYVRKTLLSKGDKTDWRRT